MESKILSFDSAQIKMLSKFKGKDKAHEHLMLVVYDASVNELHATDGKIAARIKDIKFDVANKDGQYNVTVVDKERVLLEEIEKKFPTFARIFPSMDDVEHTETLTLKKLTKDKDIAISILLPKLFYPINFRYLLDFPQGTFEVYEKRDRVRRGKDRLAPILFKTPYQAIWDIEILVMPIREV